ncbi:MAG: peptidoglycan D,D-transpeptidase FtsI family protein [Trueperaceae bacterium]
MALERPKRTLNKHRAQTRKLRSETFTPDVGGEGSVLRLRRRYLVLLLLIVPFALAFYGFFNRQNVSPNFPSIPTEMLERGRILSRDGIIFAEGPAEQRKYPQGPLAAHVVGFSGKLQKDNTYGLEGLEDTKDNALQQPRDIVITLDANIQAIAQEALKKTAMNLSVDTGSVVILESNTGRILAAASYPEFDPNTQAQVRNRAIISNKAFLHQYEPGSVMKPFVVASLLESKKLNLDSLIDTPMKKTVGEKEYQDSAEHAPQLNPWDILRYSSNSGMINMSLEYFSDTELFDWLNHIGFGHAVNTPSIYTRAGQLDPTPWVPQDQASRTIGQSVSTTTLQLAAMYNIFANDGVYLTPYLVEGDTLPQPRRVFSSSVATTMRTMLEYVVQQGQLNDIMPRELDIAGKTGTADSYDSREGKWIDDYTLSFAGFFPAQNPKITMVVSLQKEGASNMSTYIAAPLFAEISKNMSALLQSDGTLFVDNEVQIPNPEPSVMPINTSSGSSQ